jgi:hypothetical protein
MRHVLVLVRILKELVRINRVSPHGIADQLAQGRCYVPTVHPLSNAGVHLVVDALNDVVAILVAVKELDKLGVALTAQCEIGKVRWQSGGVGAKNAIDISGVGQLSPREARFRLLQRRNRTIRDKAEQMAPVCRLIRRKSEPTLPVVYSPSESVCKLPVEAIR